MTTAIAVVVVAVQVGGCSRRRRLTVVGVFEKRVTCITRVSHGESQPTEQPLRPRPVRNREVHVTRGEGR